MLFFSPSSKQKLIVLSSNITQKNHFPLISLIANHKNIRDFYTGLYQPSNETIPFIRSQQKHRFVRENLNYYHLKGILGKKGRHKKKSPAIEEQPAILYALITKKCILGAS